MPKFNFPGVVSKDALDYFREKELRVGFDYKDVWGQEHANAFTVAKAMQLDVLGDIRGAMDDALANGKTFAQFTKELTPTLQKKGWWGRKDQRDPLTGEVRDVQLGSPRRLKTIYQSNMRSARAAGQWQRVQRTKKTHPFLLYELGPSKNHRPEHAAWQGLILPVDHPFWQSHYPPNGWGCKCRVRQVSKREYERLKATDKYLTKAPPIKTKPWINKRTGEELQVPEGLAPAWMRNPGQDRVRVIRNQVTKKTKTNKKTLTLPSGDRASFTEHDHDGIKILMQDNVSPEQQISVDKMKEYINQVPAKHRSGLKEVRIIDEYFQDGGAINKKSVATFDIEDKYLEFYRNGRFEVDELDDIIGGAVRHEVGHIAESNLPKGFLNDWKKAIKSDGDYITDYAKVDIHEDVAETLMHHWSPERNDRRVVQMFFPERFKLLEKYKIASGG